MAQTKPARRLGIDHTGQVFDRLTVVERRESDLDGNARWLCRCVCGTEIVTLGASLRAGRSRSCGCLQRDTAVSAMRKHGLSNTPLYHIWEQIIQRCRNPKCRAYKNYGARGIEVCTAWTDFEAFRADLFAVGLITPKQAECGETPAGLEIDRIDNDGHYEPGNVKWSTHSENNLHRRPRSSPTAETRLKISASLSGRRTRPPTAATRAKISAALRTYYRMQHGTD